MNSIEKGLEQSNNGDTRYSEIAYSTFLSKRELYQVYKDKILEAMRRGDSDTTAIYDCAVKVLTPAQMGHIHRAMRELADELYFKDAEPL